MILKSEDESMRKIELMAVSGVKMLQRLLDKIPNEDDSYNNLLMILSNIEETVRKKLNSI